MPTASAVQRVAGFAEMAPLRALMVSAVESIGGPLERAMRSSFDLVQKLVDANARFFQSVPDAAAGVARLRQTNPSFLIHELFNRDWTLFLPSELIAELESSRLTYVASARLLEDLPILLSPEQLELLRQIPQRSLLEDARDFCLKTPLRRDVFARGTIALPAEVRLEQLLSMRFALAIPPSQCSMTAKSGGVEVTLLEHVHGQLLRALSSGSQTIAELVALPAIAPLGRDAVVNGILELAAVGYVVPAFVDARSAERKESTERLNRAFLTRATSPRPIPCLCSQLVGSGVLASPRTQLFVRASNEGADLAEYAWEALRRAGHTVMRQGQPIDNAEESLAELRRSVAEFLRSDRAFLAQHGVLRH